MEDQLEMLGFYEFVDWLVWGSTNIGATLKGNQVGGYCWNSNMDGEGAELSRDGKEKIFIGY